MSIKKILFQTILIVSAIFFFTHDVSAATYYVRTDGGPGGTSSTQCNGLIDAAFTGSNGPNCAFNHPNWPLPAKNSTSYSDNPTTFEMSGGNTLIIHGPEVGTGMYRMGCQGTPCTLASTNYTVNAVAYVMGDIQPPSGSATTPTKIYGCSINGCGQGKKPQLWMNGSMNELFTLTEKSYIEFRDIEITDHQVTKNGECRSLQDQSGYPSNSLCGKTAFKAYGGWHHLTFKGMDIHGLGDRGFLMGGSGASGTPVETLFEDTNIDGMASAGFDMDTCFNNGTCGITGNITFKRVNMRWTGCGENYPVVWGLGVTGRLPAPDSCRGQNNGGYGDMIASSDTGGNWVFEDSNFSHGTQDAIDMLYCGRTDRQAYGTCTMTIKRTLLEGNVGAAIKGPVTSVEDSFIIGNCPWWSGTIGQGFADAGFSSCRAGGTPISLSHKNSTPVKFYNNTILSNGDITFLSSGANCSLDVKNNILIGGYGQDQDETAMYDAYNSSGQADCLTTYNKDEDYNICYGAFKAKDCNALHDLDNTNPSFTGTLEQGSGPYQTSGFYSGIEYATRLALQAGSAARDAATEAVGDGVDFNLFNRGSQWDIGALEYGSVASTPTPTPTCAQNIQYCTTQFACTGQGYFWVNNTCQSGAPTCSQGVQYCTTQSTCTAQGYYWVNSTCQTAAPTCANGIQYCTTQSSCTSRGFFWVNNACQTTPPASSNKFIIGDRVEVTSGPLNIRATPSTAGTLSDTQQTSAKGTVTTGPTIADGSNWWNVNYDVGADGWSVEDFLTKALVDTGTPTSSVYRASVDFSGTQGTKNWTYRDSVGSLFTYSSTTNEWKGNEKYLLIWNRGMHPGVNRDAVRRWTSPSAGTAVITGTISDENVTCGDGIIATIRKNGNLLWQKSVANGEGQSNINVSQFSLAQGDTLDFIVNKGGTDICDGTYFDPIITLSPSTPTPTCVNGVQYCATQSTCTTQGYFWINNTCQAGFPTCANGVQYCTAQSSCTTQGYFWVNSTCQTAAPTCANGVQYCATQSACTMQGYFWINNACQAGVPTCNQGIQYCLTQTTCQNAGYSWVNNICRTNVATCADGFIYCTSQSSCQNQNYYWVNNVCQNSPVSSSISGVGSSSSNTGIGGSTVTGSIPTGTNTSTGSTTTTNAAQIAELQARVNALLAQLRAILLQMKAAGIPIPVGFEKYLEEAPLSSVSDIKLGTRGSDVFRLQEFLIAQNKGTAARALKKRAATGYFGRLTQKALIEFQTKAKIRPATGYFGAITKSYIKSLGY